MCISQPFLIVLIERRSCALCYCKRHLRVELYGILVASVALIGGKILCSLNRKLLLKVATSNWILDMNQSTGNDTLDVLPDKLEFTVTQKVVFAIICIIILFTSTLFNVSLIWFESNGPRESTFISRFHVAFHWLILYLQWINLIVNWCIIQFGTLPYAVCLIRSCITSCLLSFLAIMYSIYVVFKFLFVFRWKNAFYLGHNEILILRLIQGGVFILCLYWTCVIAVLGYHDNLVVMTCCGLPSNDKLQWRFHRYWYIALILLNVGLSSSFSFA